MNKDEYIKKYPLEYWQRQVGPGWSSLVEKCWNIAILNGTYPVQVKEKFGSLRFYINGGTRDVYDAIWAIEDYSSKICEFCGRPGKTRPTGWIKTLCFWHYAQWWLRRKYSRLRYKVIRR